MLIKPLALIAFLFLLVSCLKKDKLERGTANIKTSKEDNLFVNQYKPSVNYLMIEGNKLYIDEVWTEYRWQYKNQWGTIEKIGGKSIDMTFKDTPLLKKININDYMGSWTGNRVWTWIKDSEVKKDTIKFVYYKTKHYEAGPPEKVGEKNDSVVLYLIKVK